MKLTIFLLITAILNVSAKGLSQTVSFKGKNVPLEEIFSVVKKQTGFTVIYNAALLDKASPVSMNVRDLPLSDFLKKVFNGQPFDFSIRQRTIVLSGRAGAPLTETVADLLLAPVPVKGKVLSEDGAPLAGASVKVKNSTASGVTNAEGIFTLNASAGDVLQISFVGFETTEYKITPAVITAAQAGGTFSASITLKRSNSKLDEMQVVAYGTTSRRFSVGSVATVDAETIERQPVNNILLALQGQVAGLAINAPSGLPGARVQLQVRGQNTLMVNPGGFKPYDQPFFIVDGVPFAPKNNNINQLNNLSLGGSYAGGISQAVGMSPFSTINPDDIESVSILKDADATSIYGTQGSNGVVLITTKKGKAGKSVFNISANTGFNTSARPLTLLNTQQYLQLRKDAFAADGITPNVNNAPDLLVFDQNKYTDWQEVVNGKTANTTDIHGSLSGGTMNTTFLVSGGYNRAEVNFPGDFANQSFSFHSNLHHMSADNKFNVDLTSDVGYNYNNSPSFSGSQKAFLPPNLPDLMDAAGNLVWNYKGIDLVNYQLYAYLKTTVEMKNFNYNNSLHLSYRLLPGLNIGGSIGYNRNTTAEHSENPASSQRPAFPSRQAVFANGSAETFIVEPQLDYTYASGKGTLNVLLGGTYRKDLKSSTNMSGYGYASDNFLGSLNGSTSQYGSDTWDIYKYNAAFARVKYIYNQRYIVSLTGRRDGSSYFGPNYQFGNFGSAGLGWIFSEENAFRKAVPVISYAKLSANYGTSGSDAVESYKYQAFWQPQFGIPAFQNIQPSAPVNLYNPDYSWAVKKTFNASLDLGFFRDRLLLNVTYYRSREGNQLAAYPLPNQVGITTVVENLQAKVQNQGLEITLNSTNVKTNNFNWVTNFNISFNRNKLLSFPTLEASPYKSQYVIGKPTSIRYAYRFKGLNDTTGLFEYYTRDGKVTNSPRSGPAFSGGDQAPLINREVHYMGGLGNTLTYKNLSVHFFFQFSSQMGPNYYAGFYSGNYMPGAVISNVPLQALDYWKKPGDHTPLQKLTTNRYGVTGNAAGTITQSTGGYTDYYYTRLKTVSLSYGLPKAWTSKMHLKDVRLYANAQNLLTITDYKVADPEQFGDFSAMPLQRTIVFGLNFNF